MKKSILLVGITLLSILGFTACEMEDIDKEKPVIRLIGPAEDEPVKPGSEIHFEVELSDNVALASYKVNIHGAFDDHSHGNAVTRSQTIFSSTESDSVEFSKTWLESDFIALGEEPIAGKSIVTINHLHMEIPATISRSVNGVVKEMPLKEGHYHFIIYCTDEAGQESFTSREIFISYGVI